MRHAGTVLLWAAPALALAGLAACSPESPDAPQLPQPTVLTRTSAEPPGVNCSAGGTRVDVGVDDGSGGGAARNGALEPGEIDGTTFVCNGSPGDPCTPSPGAPPLDVAVGVSTPANGLAFLPGEQPVLQIRFIDSCGATASLGQTSRAQLFLTGPRRDVTATRTASKLLNCVENRSASNGQHHFIDLRSPSYADPLQQNLSIGEDGLVTYTLAPVTTEQAGTYTAAVYGETLDGVIQFFRLEDLQIGTVDPEPHGFIGIGATSICTRCHFGTSSGRVQMAHSLPTLPSGVPAGRYGLDSAPVAGCVACHNTAGFSPNPLVRKVHGVHRGAKQAAAGLEHPDYGLAADPTLAEFLNVEFPIQPGGEKDCAACHSDDAWATAPSRLACGTCHDAVRFDSGTISPPRIFAPFGAPACTVDDDCDTLGALLTCNTGTGRCERRDHPVQADDSACATCHTADDTGTSPVRARHDIPEHTQVRGLVLRDVVLSGGSGSGGAFQPGDVPALDFTLETADTTVTDLKENGAMFASFAASGPLAEAQRIYPVTSLKIPGTTLTYYPATRRYHYVLPTPFPASSIAPLNATGPSVPLVAGTYRLALFVYEAFSGFRDATTAIVEFPFVAGGGSPEPVRPRERVTEAACDSCHQQVQYHGGARRGVAGCITCHVDGSQDRMVGAVGQSCASDAQCAGNAAGWEACADTDATPGNDHCVVTQDPTPGRSVELSDMIHRMHGARLLGGYSSSLTMLPGRLAYVGFSNSIIDFTDHLFSVDLRNCTACHADTGSSCTSDLGCGLGQACVAGHCRNVSWTEPSTEACISCHDTAAAVAHAALETWNGIEACDACHGPFSAASVANAHALDDPSIPVRPRVP